MERQLFPGFSSPLNSRGIEVSFLLFNLNSAVLVASSSPPLINDLLTVDCKTVLSDIINFCRSLEGHSHEIGSMIARFTQKATGITEATFHDSLSTGEVLPRSLSSICALFASMQKRNFKRTYK